MEVADLLNSDNIKFVITQIANGGGSLTLWIAGLLFLILTIGLIYHAARSRPEEFNVFWRATLWVTLISSILSLFGGTALALLDLSREVPTGFAPAQQTPGEGVINLADNKRVRWLVRLIPFDPKTSPELGIDRLTHLGRSDHRYTFVADYNELRGYTAEEAVLKVGGSTNDAGHVSAILFPLDGRQLIPANARGLLQVVKALDDDLGASRQNYRALSLEKRLTEIELTSLSSRAIDSYKWENYKNDYRQYCSQAIAFKNGDYTAKTLIGGIARDWHPMGFSRRLPQGPSTEKQDLCNISWEEMLKNSQEFGSRAFLIENLALPDISGRLLIHFRDPRNQVIPDLGLK